MQAEHKLVKQEEQKTDEHYKLPFYLTRNTTSKIVNLRKKANLN